jgi:pimeloyl-ACP methyl ester carboxylesterase
VSFLTTFPEDVYPARLSSDDIGAVGFGAAQAQACMWLAQLAYEVECPPKATRILERWGLFPRAWLCRGGIGGFVAEAPSGMVVSFAGTDPMVAANWVTDFDIRIGPDGLHRGFADAIDLVWDELEVVIAGAGKPAVLLGHSLGGALAVVAAWRIACAADSASGIARVVTFGSPRGGNAAFAAAYRMRGLWPRTLRLHHGSDIVPFVPPEAVGPLAYRHVGPVMRCPRGEMFDFAVEPSDEEGGPSPVPDFAGLFAQRDAATRLGRFPAGGAASALVETLPPFLRDHLQDCYLSALGWRFAHATPAGSAASTDGPDRLMREVRDHIDERVTSLAGMMRRWLGAG